MAVKATASITLVRVNDGEDGKNAAVVSDTGPTDKTFLWCDTSVTPPILKQWNGEEWLVVNDNAEQIQKIYQDITTAISDAEGQIMLKVSETTYTKGETEQLLSDVSTELTQTQNDFLMQFNIFKQEITESNSVTNGKFENIEKYIRFVDGKIELGVIGNALKAVLANDRLSFLENNAEVAYISNMAMYIRHAVVTEDLTIGNVVLKQLQSGYFVFTKA